jgi:uncharacterized protein
LALKVAYGLRKRAEFDGVQHIKLRPFRGKPTPRREVLSEGAVCGKGALPLPVDILAERDVAVSLRDGVVIYVDVFRPVGDTPVPAIVAWTPYGKSQPLPSLSKLSAPLSGLQTFEGPDPAFWVAKGYAVVNVDIRGTGLSEGRARLWGPGEGRDGHDLVEWLAAREWCNDKVGFAGNSYLAITQWYIGAERPPHLAALAPWEGHMDAYRDSVAPGGVPDAEFSKLAVLGLVKGGFIPDQARMIEREPLMTPFWRAKIADVERVEVPTYVVASYTNKVHSRGTIRAYNSLGSKDKWLRIHNTHEWSDFYEHQDDLLKFFDRYLKGLDNGWERTPRVRMAVLDPGGTDIVNRAEARFPPQCVRYERLYLDAATGAMSRQPLPTSASVQYRARGGEDRVQFTTRFDSAVEIVGSMSLHLWVSLRGADDSDIYLQAQKLDAQGKELPVMVHGAPYSGQHGAPCEWGTGQLRVSQRKLDLARSTEEQPVLVLNEPQLPSEGEVVPIAIEIPPMAMRFRKGEQLRLTIAGHKLFTPEVTFLPTAPSPNRGTTVIHTGGRFESSLRVPQQAWPSRPSRQGASPTC